MGAALLRIAFTVHGAGWQLEGSMGSEPWHLMVIREGVLKSRQILGVFFLEHSSPRRLEYLLLSALADRALMCLPRRTQLDCPACRGSSPVWASVTVWQGEEERHMIASCCRIKTSTEDA